ncbi:MAG: sigma-70 family RNA polymerase sigma factor [Deltaproteobacteria bacterium]|nr:sigma-70 family RNA polymerase sigma factor [Deltaproteobacteria bacterium]
MMTCFAMAGQGRGLTAVTGPVDAPVLKERATTVAELDIEDVYRKYGGMVHRRCLRILGIEAEADDAAQDVFMRVVRSMERFRGQASPATWLYRIATNVSLNRIRDKRNRDRLEQQAFEPAAVSEPVEAWPRDLVLRVLLGFDGATRETVLYGVVEGMTYEEIAEVTGCSVALVRKRMGKFKSKAHKRALALLKVRS